MLALTLMKTRYFVFRIASIILAFSLCALLAEIIFRVFGPKQFHFNNTSGEYYSNPRGYFPVLKREGLSTVYGIDYHLTIHGYRSPSSKHRYNYDRSKKAPILLLLGDSFTFGRGVKYEDMYSARLQNALGRDGWEVTVKNCGITAADLEEILHIYAQESKKENPALVVYGLVLNDFGFPRPIKGLDFIDFNNPGLSYTGLRSISRLYNYICFKREEKRLETITTQAYLDAFRFPYAQQRLQELKKLNQDVRNKNATLVILLFPLLYDFPHAYRFAEIHETIGSFCKQEGILLLDLLPAFSHYRAQDLWAHFTDHHPNEIGHRIAADELYRFLKESLLLKKITSP